MTALTEAQSIRDAKYSGIISFIDFPTSGISASLQSQIDDLSDAFLLFVLGV